MHKRNDQRKENKLKDNEIDFFLKKNQNEKKRQTLLVCFNEKNRFGSRCM